MQNHSKSLIKGLSVLKKVMMSDKPSTANYLCNTLGIDKSTMSRLINTLINENFIEYVEGSKDIVLSNLMQEIIDKDDREKLILKTEPILEEVFNLTNESAHLAVGDNNALLYLNQIDKSNRVLKTRNTVGLHAPLHSNGFGKTILAFSNDIDIHNLELKKYTSNTTTSLAKLQKELALIRERGYAIGNEEHEYGLRSLGVAYLNVKNEFVGAIGISGLAMRLDTQKLHEYGQKIFALINN